MKFYNELLQSKRDKKTKLLIITMPLRKVSTLLGVILALGLFSCNSRTNADNGLSAFSDTEVQDNIRMLLMTPDSLRSEKNNLLLQQLEAMIYDYCIVENGQFQLKVGKREWKKQGMKGEYYEMLREEIKDLNNFLDTTSFSKQLVLDSYRNAKQEYEQRRKSEHLQLK